MTLLAVSYVLLVPGLLGTHLHYRVTAMTPWGAMVALETQTGIRRLCTELYRMGGLVHPTIAVLIFIWGVVLPMVKLAVTIYHTAGGKYGDLAMVVLQRLSKWAMVDAMIPVIWGALLSTTKPIPGFDVQVSLQPAFLCYLGHVLLSTVVFLLAKPPCDEKAIEAPQPVAEPEAPEETPSRWRRWFRGWSESADVKLPLRSAAPQPPETEHPSNASLLATLGPKHGFCTFLALVILTMALVFPVLKFDVTMLALSEELSIVQMIRRLQFSNLWVACLSMILFTVILPAVDLVFGFLQLASQRIDPVYQLWVESFAMFDVLMAGLVVSRLSMIVLGPAMPVEMLPAGVAGCAAALAWAVYTLMGRPRPKGDQDEALA